MSKIRRYGKRDANERRIIEALRYNGCGVIQIDEPCDLIVAHHGQTFLLEVKQPGGKLTPEEEKWWALEWPGEREIVHTIHETFDAIRPIEPRAGTPTDFDGIVTGQTVVNGNEAGTVLWNTLGWRVICEHNAVYKLTPEWRPV